jgi:hypothetical protein
MVPSTSRPPTPSAPMDASARSRPRQDRLVAPAVLPPVSCQRLTIATLPDTLQGRFLLNSLQRMRSLKDQLVAPAVLPPVSLPALDHRHSSGHAARPLLTEFSSTHAVTERPTGSAGGLAAGVIAGCRRAVGSRTRADEIGHKRDGAPGETTACHCQFCTVRYMVCGSLVPFCVMLIW